MTSKKMTPEIADMLRAREQLMEDIDAIVDCFDWSFDDTDTLVTRLCDAVCKNFPLLMEENV